MRTNAQATRHESANHENYFAPVTDSCHPGVYPGTSENAGRQRVMSCPVLYNVEWKKRTLNSYLRVVQ